MIPEECTHVSTDDITDRAGNDVGYHCNECLVVWDIGGNRLDITAGELSRRGV